MIYSIAAFLILLFGLFSAPIAMAQPPQYKEANVKESLVYTFDAARPIVHFDASPDGTMWFAVDRFGLLQNMIANGERIAVDFNTIPVGTAQLSPDGSYIIWMGLERSINTEGFNTTKTSLFRSFKNGNTYRNELVGTYQSDYNLLQFFPSFGKWVALLPASNIKQQGERDLVIENGKIIAKGHPRPTMFSYDSTGTRWAYRSTEEARENIVTADGLSLLWKRSDANPNVASDEPVVMHFSPQNKLFGSIIDGRDYELDFKGEASLFKTSYFPKRRDTAQSYLIFQNKKHPLFRWITSIQIDTTGKNIAYFAATPNTPHASKESSRGVVISNGKQIAGPYTSVGRLLISPTGKGIVWTAIAKDAIELYLNGKIIGPIAEYLDVAWTRDEKNIAYITTSLRGKFYVSMSGKVSPLYDRIGRLAFTADGKAIEFMAIRNTKLLKVRMSL